MACGPRPDFQIATDKSPGAVWKGFKDRYAGITSLAISGKLIIRTHKVFECKLEIGFIRPDSICFFAEGPLGVDLAQGYLIGDSGMVDFPKSDTRQKFSSRDYLYIEQEDIAIPIGALQLGLVFFANSCSANYMGGSGETYRYDCRANDHQGSFFIDRDRCLPGSRLLIIGADTARTEYSHWRTFDGGLIFPQVVKIIIPNLPLNLEIRSSRIEARFVFPKSLFKNKLN